MKSLKGIIFSIFLGICLLPIGIYLQKNSADQMPYQKYYNEAKKTTDFDSSNDQESISITGIPKFSSNIPATVITENKYSIPGQYIKYTLTKKQINETQNKQTQKKTYKYIKSTSFKSSTSSFIIINKLKINIDDFTKILIPKKHIYLIVKNNSGKSTTLIQDTAPKPTQEDFQKGNYIYEFTGYIYDSNVKEYSATGILNKENNTLLPIKHNRGSDSLLLLSSHSKQKTYELLLSSAKSESRIAFILGVICFTIGFSLIFSPIIKLFGCIPVIGNFASGLIYIITALLALLLSILFYTFFKFFWLIVFTATFLIIAYFIYKRKKAY